MLSEPDLSFGSGGDTPSEYSGEASLGEASQSEDVVHPLPTLVESLSVGKPGALKVTVDPPKVDLPTAINKIVVAPAGRSFSGHWDNPNLAYSIGYQGRIKTKRARRLCLAVADLCDALASEMHMVALMIGNSQNPQPLLKRLRFIIYSVPITQLFRKPEERDSASIRTLPVWLRRIWEKCLALYRRYCGKL